MADVRKSFLLSFADSYLAIVLQLASAVVISRLLTPAEVGVFAIAAVFSALASTFRDFGIGEYLIQANNLDHAKIRAAFGMNIAVSWAMAAAMFFSAPYAAVFYREAGVQDVMQVLSLSFLMVPFGAIVQCWFRRELQYRPIVITNALSSITVFIVSVLLALLGHGYMSLAWSTVAGIAVTVAGAMYFRPRDFPRWPALRGFREVFDFGKYATAMYLLMQLGRGAPELILGRVAGAAEVGIFSRANGLVEIFRRLTLRPVMQVCLPYFASAHRSQGAIAPAYASSVTMLTAAGWPFLAFVALAAYPLVRIVYGPQWLDAVPLAQVLCLACAIELLFFLSREALLACGRARLASLLQSEIIVLQVLGLLLAIPLGLYGAAWGLALAACGGWALAQRRLASEIGLSAGMLARAVAPSLVLTAWSVGPLVVCAYFVPIGEHNFVAWAMAGVLAVAALWVIGLWRLGHPLWAELRLLAGKLR